jgi:hypothetical protein
MAPPDTYRRGIAAPELTTLKLTLLSVIVPPAIQRPPPLALRTAAEPEFTFEWVRDTTVSVLRGDVRPTPTNPDAFAHH